MKILEILLLIIPVTAWALWNDRNGDDHKTINDVFWEAMIMNLFSYIVFCMEGNHIVDYIKSLIVSIAGFGLIFPYAFNYMWFNKWYNDRDYRRWLYVIDHLSETAIPDKWFIKYNIHWAVRLALYVTLFGLSLYWFI